SRLFAASFGSSLASSAAWSCETTGGTDIVNVSCAEAGPAGAAAMIADAIAVMKTACIFAFLSKRNSFANAGVTRQASAARVPDKRNVEHSGRSRMHIRYLALAGVSLLFSTTPAFAQDAGAADENVIVVTGRGLDAPPSVIAYSTITLDR